LLYWTYVCRPITCADSSCREGTKSVFRPNSRYRSDKPYKALICWELFCRCCPSRFPNYRRHRDVRVKETDKAVTFTLAAHAGRSVLKMWFYAVARMELSSAQDVIVRLSELGSSGLAGRRRMRRAGLPLSTGPALRRSRRSGT
jgi:hypothetical protein